MKTTLFLGVLAVLAQNIRSQRSEISTAPVFDDGPAIAPRPRGPRVLGAFGQRAFRCTDSNGRLTEKWTLTRNFADNTCTHNIEQFLAGRKADELVLTGQDCDYEPPCVREARELGTFNNNNSGSRNPKTINTNNGGRFSARPASGSKLADGGTCTYVCKQNRFCNVNFKANGLLNGSTKGLCFDYENQHDCEGTPRFCSDCDSKCRGRVGATFSELVGPAQECPNTDPFCRCHFDRQINDCVCACA